MTEALVSAADVGRLMAIEAERDQLREEIAALTAERDRLAGLLDDVIDFISGQGFANSSYCEICDRHAPKDYDGDLTGPVPHTDACLIGKSRAALREAPDE